MASKREQLVSQLIDQVAPHLDEFLRLEQRIASTEEIHGYVVRSVDLILSARRRICMTLKERQSLYDHISAVRTGEHLRRKLDAVRHEVVAMDPKDLRWDVLPLSFRAPGVQPARITISGTSIHGLVRDLLQVISETNSCETIASARILYRAIHRVMEN